MGYIKTYEHCLEDLLKRSNEYFDNNQGYSKLNSFEIEALRSIQHRRGR